MNNFQFLSYKDVNERLEKLVNNKENKIVVKKEFPLGFTAYNLPIEHYSIGSGPKHIVVTGSYHIVLWVKCIKDQLRKMGC